MTKLLYGTGSFRYSWVDEMGACKVCQGEVPHGHHADCDILKMETEIKDLKAIIVSLEEERKILKAFLEFEVEFEVEFEELMLR